MKIKVKLDEGARMPTRAHEDDAGLDLYARESVVLWPRESYTFDTGVHIAIPKGYVGLLKSKSSLNINGGLVGEGVIDSGYTGEIRVKLYNNGNQDVRIFKGNKIIQLVIVPIITPEPELVDELEKTERGDNGFGSSGR